MPCFVRMEMFFHKQPKKSPQITGKRQIPSYKKLRHPKSSRCVKVWYAAMKVENIGLEPMTSCMPCKRSSQLS